MTMFKAPRWPSSSGSCRSYLRRAFLMSIISMLFFSTISSAQTLSLNDVLSKLQSNKSKIVDMYDEIKTTMTGQGKMASMNSTQSSIMWTKGDDKSKIEMLSPIKQTTIRNGDTLVIIDKNTGRKTVKDLTKDKYAASASGQGAMDFERLKEMFDLSIDSSSEYYVIECKPKKSGLFGKIEICVDTQKYIPSKILIYDKNNKIINQTTMEYKDFLGVFVPVKTISTVDSPLGKMNINVEYSNIKVNEGIEDSEFEIK